MFWSKLRNNTTSIEIIFYRVIFHLNLQDQQIQPLSYIHVWAQMHPLLSDKFWPIRGIGATGWGHLVGWQSSDFIYLCHVHWQFSQYSYEYQEIAVKRYLNKLKLNMDFEFDLSYYNLLGFWVLKLKLLCFDSSGRECKPLLIWVWWSFYVVSNWLKTCFPLTFEPLSTQIVWSNSLRNSVYIFFLFIE